MIQVEDTETGKMMFFISVSIVCMHFQRFSNTLQYIFKKITAITCAVTNYLDDFLLVGTNATKW